MGWHDETADRMAIVPGTRGIGSPVSHTPIERVRVCGGLTEPRRSSGHRDAILGTRMRNRLGRIRDARERFAKEPWQSSSPPLSECRGGETESSTEGERGR